MKEAVSPPNSVSNDDERTAVIGSRADGWTRKSLDIVASIRSILNGHREEQLRVNSTSAKLHSLSFFVNYATAMRACSLEEELKALSEKVSASNATLENVESTVHGCNELIDSVEAKMQQVEIEQGRQSKVLSELSDTFDRHRDLVLHQQAEHERRLDRHYELLRQQQLVLKKLLQFRFRMDFAVDIAVLLAARSLTSSKPCRLLVLAVVKAMRPATRQREERLTQFFTLLLFVLAYQYMKLFVVSKGIHQMVGNFADYATEAFKLARNAFRYVK